MEATNVVFNGTFIARINDFQDMYEFEGVRYAVEEEYAPEYGVRYWATPVK